MLTVCPLPPVLLLVPPQASSSETAAVLLRPTATARSRNVRRVIRPTRILVMISSMTSPCSRIIRLSPLDKLLTNMHRKHYWSLHSFACQTSLFVDLLQLDVCHESLEKRGTVRGNTASSVRYLRILSTTQQVHVR